MGNLQGRVRWLPPPPPPRQVSTDNINFWLSAIAHVGLPSVTLGLETGVHLYSPPAPHPHHARFVSPGPSALVSTCLLS